jgi:hypothetical protein
MDGIDSAIAVVGIYFSLMAVLAVSVEAVIGWFKIPTWSPLQGKPSPDDVLKEVQGWLPEPTKENGVAKKADWKARITALNKVLESLGQQRVDEDTSLDDVAKAIGKAYEKHIQNERLRRGGIRVFAVALGIGFAVLFQIDTLNILAPLSEGAQELWMNNLGVKWSHVVGLVLSGLAASAGSSFWHDQSARLRNLKKVAKSVGEATSG